eukprot:938906-Prymnesium_polylepis.1
MQMLMGRRRADPVLEYTPAIHIKAGEHVVDGEFMNKVPGAQLWYTPMEGEARKTVVRVKQ